jgi:predicted short-subunit dehydrogenase-like oxidoreductase (DUF2520 family)
MSQFEKISTVDGGSFHEHLVVGRGKLARHLLFSFKIFSPQLSVRSWNRHQSLEDLEALVEKASVVSLCTSDDSLDEVASLIDSFRPRGLLVHHSGSKNIKDIWSLHPLMTFNGFEPYPKQTYGEIPFVVSSPPNQFFSREIGLNIFEKCFPGWKNKIYFVSAEQKVRYHLACVIAGNFANILWEDSSSHLKDLGLPPEVLKPYLQQCLRNFFADPKGSLTGPLQRGDETTLRAHTEALKHDSFLPIYEAFLNFVRSNKNTRGSK